MQVFRTPVISGLVYLSFFLLPPRHYLAKQVGHEVSHVGREAEVKTAGLSAAQRGSVRPGGLSGPLLVHLCGVDTRLMKATGTANPGDMLQEFTKLINLKTALVLLSSKF